MKFSQFISLFPLNLLRFVLCPWLCPVIINVSFYTKYVFLFAPVIQPASYPFIYLTATLSSELNIRRNTRASQMKTVKVWGVKKKKKFETPLDCPVSWQKWYSWFEEWPTGGSTMQERNYYGSALVWKWRPRLRHAYLMSSIDSPSHINLWYSNIANCCRLTGFESNLDNTFECEGHIFFFFSFGVLPLMHSEAPQPYGLLYYPPYWTFSTSSALPRPLSRENWSCNPVM
jgi:hypothetical protein